LILTIDRTLRSFASGWLTREQNNSLSAAKGMIWINSPVTVRYWQLDDGFL
jgi:hypothetical protein